MKNLINENEIIANQLNNKNDWNEISKQKLSIEQMQKWINHLNWYYVSENNIIPKDIFEQIISKIDTLTLGFICNNQNLSKEFILKYKDKVNKSILDINHVLLLIEMIKNVNNIKIK